MGLTLDTDGPKRQAADCNSVAAHRTSGTYETVTTGKSAGNSRADGTHRLIRQEHECRQV